MLLALQKMAILTGVSLYIVKLLTVQVVLGFINFSKGGSNIQ